CKGNLKGCDCQMPDDVYNNIQELAENLQIVRDMLDEPIKINSGWRCEEYNRKIKGAKRSQHLLGKAADIRIKDLTPDEVANAIDKLQEGGFIKKGGLGRYNSFTHIDIRGRNARWDNRK
ncbi:MAG: D-Ala-D-Ala carboxypeptidase family metallohydrolase, partial [Flavobacteriales bacterium]|nr:D-Ala-D-Ala carboxypeptidase family metallohydrolase [Flavobacteriales bacterium]